MSKRLLHIVIALLGAFALFLVSCTDGTNSEQRVVSVTIQPQRYIAEQIAGDRFVINCVVPAGSNPEAYDPTPRQLIEIDRSEAYLKVGGMLGFEVAWLQRLSQNNPDMKIYDTSHGVAMLTSTHHHRHDNGVEHVATGIDPHIWSSPRNVRIMARNICGALTELDADNAAYYANNYNQFIQHIDSVEAVVSSLLMPCRGETFAIYHPSLSYFAQDYGLKQLCLEQMGKENSALSMKESVDEARRAGVRVVFVQREFNPRQVETFAGELDAEIVMINPLNYDWDTEIIDIAHAIAR